MIKNALRNELANLLRNNRKDIVDKWSNNIFKVPGHRRLKDIIPKKMHAAGMDEFLRALALDIKDPGRQRSYDVLKRLILKSFLSASTAEDALHGIVILRSIIIDRLALTYKSDFRRLRDIMRINEALLDKEMLYIAKIYGRRDFSRIETMMKYGKRLIAVRDLNRLCRLILEAAVKESDSDRASLMLLKDKSLYIKCAVGIPERVVSVASQRLGSGIAGRVAKTAKPVIINEGQRLTPPAIKRSLRGLGLVSAVSIPIISEKEVIGVINLGKRRKKIFFDEEDVELLSILAYEAGTAITNCRLFEETQDLYIGSVISLAAAIDARDHYTHGHSNRVARLATSMARNLKLSIEDIDKIYCASMLHDIGKIGIPDSILLKPGKLTKKEFEIVKRHPIYGVRILKHIPRLRSIIPIIYHEHEHYDGKGYVKGIKGQKIPIESRIIFIADAYEAMTSNRPYRKALSKEAAIAELKRCSGTQFDPVVVKAFLKTIRRR